MGIRFDLARHDDVMRALLALIIAFGLLTDATGALAEGPKHHHKAKGTSSKGSRHTKHATHHRRHTTDHRRHATHHDRRGPRVQVPKAPMASSSRYMTHTNGSRSKQLGCSMGSGVRRGKQHRDALVILDYGMPMHHKGRFGTSAFGPFRTMDQIANSVQQYARGYVQCVGWHATSRLRIGVGTSNYGRDVTFRHGQLWGALVERINHWFSERHMADRVVATGANDIEPGWRGPGPTRRWIRGYATRTRMPYYDFGGAAGCPPYNDCLGNWTVEDVWYVAWGSGLGIPLPEVYAESGISARQWYHLSLYGYRHHHEPMRIAGVMTQVGACKGHTGCAGLRNSPDRGFAQLYRALNADPRTAQPLRWVTDITWRN
jgi:hypothetical protein